MRSSASKCRRGCITASSSRSPMMPPAPAPTRAERRRADCCSAMDGGPTTGDAAAVWDVRKPMTWRVLARIVVAKMQTVSMSGFMVVFVFCLFVRVPRLMSSGLACFLVLLLSVSICKHKWRCVCHVHEGNYHHYCSMEASSDSSQSPLPPHSNLVLCCVWVLPIFMFKQTHTRTHT